MAYTPRGRGGGDRGGRGGDRGGFRGGRGAPRGGGRGLSRYSLLMLIILVLDNPIGSGSHV